MTATSILEVRDAFAATLSGLGASVVGNTAKHPNAPAVVIAPGSPWFVPDVTGGLTQFGRKWRWEIHVVVSQADSEGSFRKLATITDAVVGAIFADGTLGGEVLSAEVESVGPNEDREIAAANLLVAVVYVVVET